MQSTETKRYTYPDFVKLPRTLLGTGEVVTRESTVEVTQDSIVIWPAERVVAATDFQPITLWEAPAGPIGRVLPVTKLSTTPITQGTISSRQVLPSTDRFSSRVVDSQKVSTKSRTILRFALLAIMIISLVVMASVVVPDVYYRLLPENASDVVGEVTPAETQVFPVATPTPVLPPIDANLPQGDWLRIPGIGVDAGVLTSPNADEALEQGAWMVPDFGRPTDFTQATIIASHRYGWLKWWQTDFGRKNSFYYLPEVVVGDRIEVISGQRKFVYTVYAKEEGQLITDYDADLILYTCKFLNSPERYFVYAKREPVAQF